MKKIITLFALGATMMVQAQKVNIWIDITDKSLIQSHLDKANEAVNILAGNLTNIEYLKKINLKLQVSKLSHNPFAEQFRLINTKAIMHDAVEKDNTVLMKKSGALISSLIKNSLNSDKFKYEHSENTAIYDNLSVFLDNGNKADIILIFSDFQENTTLSSKPLDFGDTVIHGIITARDGKVRMGSVNFWKKVLPGIKMKGNFN